MDETDINRVQLGQPVILTLDALQGRPVRGRVTAIAPQATTTQGVTSYQVSIGIDNNNGDVQPGMTATATIVYDRRDNVLVVPNRAIRRQGRDQVVDVLAPDGKIETRTIQRGLSNDQQSEVVDGLAEGEQVVLPTTQTRTPQMAGGMPGFGGGFGGPFIRR